MKEIVTTVGEHNGGMSLFIDNVPQASTLFKITETPCTEDFLSAAEVEIPAMAQNGINLCWVPLFLDWSGPGNYDFTDFDLRIETVLRHYDAHTPPGSPAAYVGVRVQAAVFHPSWYIDANRDADGEPTNLIEFRAPLGNPDLAGHTVAISPGDVFWDTHAIDCLRAIVEHVRSSSYAHRVFGWLPCALNSNEWFIRTFFPEACCDYSAPARKAFQDHLAKRGLSGDLPTPRDCQDCGHGEFLEGTGGVLAEEFSLWLNNRVADIILNFAKTIKELQADSPKIVGFFYGYTTELSFFQNLAQSGHLGLRKILDSDLIDFLCSPCQIRYRCDEGEFTYSMVLGPFADSAGICNKLSFIEDDHPPVRANQGAHVHFSTRDRWHDEMFFRLTFAQTIASGQQLWWYSLMSRWFDEEYRQEIVASLHKVGVEAIAKDRSPLAEVAVVVDERSVQTMRLNPSFQCRLILDSLAACFPTGTPIECHELHSFLDHADHSRFKAVVFTNLFWLDDELIAKLERLKNDNRMLIFQFTPGLLNGAPENRVFSTQKASELTGMILEEESQDIPLTVWMDPERVPWANDEDIRYGWLDPELPAQPVIGVNDPAAVPLGFLHRDIPGFAMRRHSNWTSVFSAAPRIPTQVMRRLFKEAGVHIYIESDDVVYANRSLFACSASSRGMKTLTLPQGTAKLVDVCTGEEAPISEGRVSLFMKRREVKIFWIE